MPSLDELKDALGDDTKDLRLNLGNVLGGGSLDARQRYAVALTCALFLGDAGAGRGDRPTTARSTWTARPSPTRRPPRRSWR